MEEYLLKRYYQVKDMFLKKQYLDLYLKEYFKNRGLKK